MKTIVEILRRESPAPKPQSLAWDGHSLWMGSRDTKHVYQLDPSNLQVQWQVAAPGVPWGMTVVGAELRVLCGETAADHRIVRRLVPGTGFDGSFALACPDDTGSQLGFDGQRLQVSQWYPKKLILLGADGQPQRVIQVPHGICGQVFVGEVCYLVTTDHEETTKYWLTRVDLRAASPQIEDIAHIPFAARALAFDGKSFWTNHREQNQIVSFERPD